jgi:hypothetical protein
VTADVEPDLIDGDVFGVDVLIVAHTHQEARNEGFDDEHAVIGQVGRHVLERANLVVLGEQVEERVVDDEDHPVGPVDRNVGEVAHRHGDVLAARLVSEPRHHGGGTVDAVHPHSTFSQGQADATGPDRELECGAPAGELREERDGGDLVPTQLVVVDRGDFLAVAPQGIEPVHRPAP